MKLVNELPKKENHIFAIQTGARHEYAIPLGLQRHGLLSAFLTDFAVGERTSRTLRSILFPTWAKKILVRTLPREISSTTRCVHSKLNWRTWVGATPTDREYWEAQLVKAVDRHCPEKSDVVVGLFLEAVSAFERLKPLGIKSVMEVYIAPHSALIVAEENKRYPEFADARYDKMCETADVTWARAVAATDFYIAPSQFVVDGLRHFGVDTHNVRVVPYGVPNRFFEVKNTPTPKRILFVGTADIRKGVHYFAQAAHRLRDEGFEFHVIGSASQAVQQLFRECNVIYHGRIPRIDTLKHYGQADMFVLPSLAEGSATVAYEAMASGVPVITTPNAGTVITDEQDGIIVPIRDVDELLKQIKRVAEDRKFRDKLAGQAKVTAAGYRLDEYGDRFVRAITALTEENDQPQKTKDEELDFSNAKSGI